MSGMDNEVNQCLIDLLEVTSVTEWDYQVRLAFEEGFGKGFGRGLAI